MASSEETLAVNGDTKKPSKDLESKVKEAKGEAIGSNSWTPRDEIYNVNQDCQLNKNKKEVFPVGDERDSPVQKLKICESDGNPFREQIRRIQRQRKGKTEF